METINVSSKGLLKEGEYLAVHIPANNRVLIFRILGVANGEFNTIDYGAIPIDSDTVVASFDGEQVTIPEHGVMPPRSYIPLTSTLSFPLQDAFDDDDMWYVPEEYRDRLFHVITKVTPNWLRIDVTIPKGASQIRFQRDRMMLGIEKPFGFTRGSIEMIHIPRLHYGYRFANDSNLYVKTHVEFKYAEYIVRIPTDAELIFNLAVRRYPCRWISLPINVMDPQITIALTSTYGIDGFPIFPYYRRSTAINFYDRLIQNVRKEVKDE